MGKPQLRLGFAHHCKAGDRDTANAGCRSEPFWQFDLGCNDVIIIIIIINKVLIKVTLNKVIAGALYIVICG